MKKVLVGCVCLLLGIVLACKHREQFHMRFSHAKHVTEQGMACSDCHGELQHGAFAAPGHEQCMACHEETDAAEHTQQTCGMCHLVQAEEYAAAKVAAATPTRGTFVHTEALADRCAECHGSLLDESAETIRPMTRADVVAMREKAHAVRGADCRACHVDLDRDTVPPNHRQDWVQRHGAEARDPQAACLVCHEQSTCTACHQTEQPRSHTNLFRTQTHGVEASWDRERCMVCHKEAACANCHREIAPRSHGAGWIERHGTAMNLSHNCSVCHQPDSCASCHRLAPPRSHTAGWADRHCKVCHEGQQAGTGCNAAGCHQGGIDVHEGLRIPHPPLAIGCLNAGCHNPVTGGVHIRLDPLRHPFLDEHECLSCHKY